MFAVNHVCTFVSTVCHDCKRDDVNGFPVRTSKHNTRSSRLIVFARRAKSRLQSVSGLAWGDGCLHRRASSVPINYHPNSVRWWLYGLSGVDWHRLTLWETTATHQQVSGRYAKGRSRSWWWWRRNYGLRSIWNVRVVRRWWIRWLGYK